MKNKVLISISIILVLVLGGVLIWLTSNNVSSSAESSVSFYNFSSVPSKVKVENIDKPFTMSTSQDGFKIEGLEDIPLNESFCTALVKSVQSMKADSLFAPSEPLSSYGLESPKLTITSTFDGKDNKLYIGNSTPEKASYYCRLNNDDKIAIVKTASLNPILKTKDQYISLTLMPYSGKEMDDSGNWISGGATKCTIIREDLEVPIVAEAGSDCKMSISSPQGYKVSDTAKAQLENSAFSLTANSVYKTHPNDELISSCGLSSPKATISYVINGETYTLKVGSVASTTQHSNIEPGEHNHSHGEGEEHSHEHDHEASNNTVYASRYVLLEGTPVVYTISENSLPWLTMEFNK